MLVKIPQMCAHKTCWWVRVCAALQGVVFEDMCSFRVYFFANFSVCALLGMFFNLIISYVFPQGIQSQGYLIVPNAPPPPTPGLVPLCYRANTYTYNALVS